jgi:hypothetical protein
MGPAEKLEMPTENPGNATDLAAYRNSERERDRVSELFRLIPASGRVAIDIGARDGFLSLLLAERFEKVVALDLESPQINHPAVECVKGDVTRLQFPDRTFDLVLCAEVLEHIPPDQLRKACAELARVAARHVVIGVPYDQDIRADRTTCRKCGGVNPPWGHVNTFDEMRLELLFPELKVEKILFVGETRDRTNAVSAWLTNLAGNPYGTYGQEEGCVHCGAKLVPPGRRNPARRLAGFLAHVLRRGQRLFLSPRPNWIHVLYSKPA